MMVFMLTLAACVVSTVVVVLVVVVVAGPVIRRPAHPPSYRILRYMCTLDWAVIFIYELRIRMHADGRTHEDVERNV